MKKYLIGGLVAIVAEIIISCVLSSKQSPIIIKDCKDCTNDDFNTIMLYIFFLFVLLVFLIALLLSTS